MKPLGWLQVALGLFGLIAQVAFAGSLVAAGPGATILATSFNILAIVSGALLLRQAKAGPLTSLLLWGVQIVQVLTPQFAFDFLFGPYIRLLILPGRMSVSLGASFTNAALGSQVFSSARHEVGVNCLALVVVAYLFRHSRSLLRARTLPVAGGLTSA